MTLMPNAQARADRNLRADATHADYHGRLAAQFDAGEIPVPCSDVLLIVVLVQVAREQEQHGRERVVGDFRSLHDLVVRQNDVAVAQIVAAGEEKVGLHAGAHD